MNPKKQSFFVAVIILTAIIGTTVGISLMDKATKSLIEINSPAPSQDNNDYNLGEFSGQVANSNSTLELCDLLSPMLKDTTATVWEFDYNHNQNPTDFLVYIYPNIQVAGGTGIVRFTSDKTVDAWRLAPTKNGYKAYTATDPEEREYLIKSAMEKTGGNVGYLVTYKDITPNTDLKDAIGTCTPISYKE